MFEGLVGIGIFIGFIASWVLNMTSLSIYMTYVDPILTIIIAAVFGIIPVFAIKDCIKELMLATPTKEITDILTNKIDEISRDYDYSKRVLRFGKVGGRIIIEVDYLVTSNSKLCTISQQDQLRGNLANSFADLPYKKSLTINFTNDAKWTEHLS